MKGYEANLAQLVGIDQSMPTWSHNKDSHFVYDGHL